MNQINQAEAMESCSNLQADRDLLVNENIGLAYSFAKTARTAAYRWRTCARKPCWDCWKPLNTSNQNGD